MRIAVLPLGAHEQHGPHLPFETDTLIAQAVARRALAKVSGHLDIDLLDTEPVGYSIEHSDFEGTRTLAFDEAVRRWVGIGEEAFGNGTRRFVMLNAHGGNSPLMTVVAHELRARRRMLAVATSWTRFGFPDGLLAPEEKALGIHGGLAETAIVLALRPDLVDMDKARDFPSAQKAFAERFRHLRAYGPHAFGWIMRDLSPEGAVGNAAAATPEIGEALLDHAAAGFAALLEDVARFDLGALA